MDLCRTYDYKIYFKPKIKFSTSFKSYFPPDGLKAIVACLDSSGRTPIGPLQRPVKGGVVVRSPGRVVIGLFVVDGPPEVVDGLKII